MWFITKNKHGKIVEKLNKDISDLKLKAIKDAKISKTYLEILNKKVIARDLELKKRPVYACSDSAQMQLTIEKQKKLLTNMSYKLRSDNDKWFCDTCGIERRRDDETRKYKGGMLQSIIEI